MPKKTPFAKLDRAHAAATLSALAILPAMLYSMAAQADVVIDSFSGPSKWHHQGAGAFAEVTGTVLGGVREVAYDFTSPDPDIYGNDFYLSTTKGWLIAATANPLGDDIGRTFTLTYDGALSGTPRLNADLSQANAIVVQATADFWKSSRGESLLAVSLTDNAGLVGTLSLNPGASPNIFSDIVFQLANPAYAAINLHQIERIAFSYTAAPDADTYFNALTIKTPLNNVAMPVPEADALYLMLAGMGLVTLLARRNKQ